MMMHLKWLLAGCIGLWVSVSPHGRLLLAQSRESFYVPTASPTFAREAAVIATRDGRSPHIDSMSEPETELKVIHRRSQVIRFNKNILRNAVADPSVMEVIQFNPDEIATLGLSVGTTSLTVWFENVRDPVVFLVETMKDPSLEDRKRHDYGQLEKKLTLLFPNSKVYLIPMSGKIIVKGQAKDSEEAAKILQIVRGEVINQNGSLGGAQPGTPGGGGGGTTDYWNNINQGGFNDQASSNIVNLLDVPGEFQVALRVRIAELNRSMLRRAGVNFDLLLNDGAQFFASAVGGAPANITSLFNNGEVNVLINALATNGQAKILAEPTVTVLSGHPASFLSGGEFAVPTIVGVGGAQGTSTQFRGFGASIFVTPTVIDRDVTRLQVTTEFSAINPQNSVGGVPGLSSRRVQTTVEVREGQTMALAGLFSHQSETEIDRVPFLGEIPIIGSLVFNGKRATQDEKELLILITPELVRPLEPDEVPPVPGHEVIAPNDWELFMNAQLTGAPDTRVYQVPPYGHGSGHGQDVGYSQFNPQPAIPQYTPQAGGAYGGLPASNGYTPFSGPYTGSPASRYPVAPGPGRAGAQAAPAQSLAPQPQNLPRNYPTPVGPSAGRPGRYGVTPAGGFLGQNQAPQDGGIQQAGFQSPQPTPPPRRSWLGFGKNKTDSSVPNR
jgi:pilus assembly protein CpaC